MATVTEPPWLNKTGGTAARNGTTSHTVTFGFTATAGSLLVLYMGGAVTNTIASGWTERQQPVSSAELSMWTATGAGQTSVTVTHNGSNYPVGWCLYEFPVGSTYTGSNASTPSDDTWPAYTGLPGTAQVIIAARCRSCTSGGAAPSQVWTAPWVEDLDAAAAASPTDGTYVTVAHAINITATSITPASTPTYGTGSFSPDREIVLAAFTVAALSAPNTGTASASAAYAITNAGKRTPKGTATGSAAYAVTAAGTRTPKGAASASAAYVISGAGKRTPKGAATLATSYVATAAGAHTSAGEAVAAHSWAVTASGARHPQGSASVAIDYTALAGGSHPLSGAAMLIMEYTPQADGSRVSLGEAAASTLWNVLAVSGGMSAGNATLSTAWAATAEGTKAASGTAALGHQWTVNAEGSRSSAGTATLAAGWVILAVSGGTNTGTATLTTAWGAQAAGSRASTGQATLGTMWVVVAVNTGALIMVWRDGDTIRQGQLWIGTPSGAKPVLGLVRG